MALEGVGEGHEGEFAKGVDTLFRYGRCLGFVLCGCSRSIITALDNVQIEFSPDVAGAGCEDDSDISVGWLHT